MDQVWRGPYLAITSNMHGTEWPANGAMMEEKKIPAIVLLFGG